MTCGVTKVTHNMYSCDTGCMSREMMETDSRYCATCQNPREGTWMAFLEFLMIIRTKLQIVIIFFLQKERGNVQRKEEITEARFLGF